MTDAPDPHVTSSEVEIAASPEEIWAAITTASGSAAWSFPADVEPREGGAVRVHRGPYGPDASATVTAWHPPHRFAYEERASADATFATEFLVSAREHGSCVVRVVSSLYADDSGRSGVDGWDNLAEEAGAGWRMSLLLLRSYVTHFSGLPAARLDFSVPVSASPADRAEVGAIVAAALGLSGLTEGESFRTPENAPSASGTIEHLGPYFMLLRAAQPCPALFAISSFPMSAGTLSVNVTGRLYGQGAEAVAARERPSWHEWLARLAAGINH